MVYNMKLIDTVVYCSLQLWFAEKAPPDAILRLEESKEALPRVARWSVSTVSTALEQMDVTVWRVR